MVRVRGQHFSKVGKKAEGEERQTKVGMVEKRTKQREWGVG